MKENFWRELPRPFFVLAPMEDVTDVVFRHVVSEAGRPDVFFTEFTNTESFCHPEGVHSVRGRLTFTEDEQPIVAHIWGDKPDHFREMSIGMAEMGFKGIDLNMGCPVPNVAAKGKGQVSSSDLKQRLKLFRRQKQAVCRSALRRDSAILKSMSGEIG
jgi:tRNA-dihydrouridine synthase